MRRYLCHDQPEKMEFETVIEGAEPGGVHLRDTWFYPGGCFWHRLDQNVELHGTVLGRIDPVFRSMMAQLHTDLHIVNALVFREFDGALVTGVQMSDDGTARIDFDLPDADNDRIRSLEPAVNDAIRADLAVRAIYAGPQQLKEEAGLLRSRSVAPPPQPDGLVRIIEIREFDRQACGGTHLSSTGQSRPVRILKIDNKGRHNRRVRISLI